MKTRIFLTTLLLFSTIVVFAGAVNARGRETAMVLKHELLADETLQLENWMVNECYWKCMQFNCFSRDYDSPAELEGWMADISGWEVAALTPAAAETGQVLESWMTRTESWDVYPYMQAEADSSLGLEPWMIDQETWNHGGSRMATANQAFVPVPGNMMK